MATNIEEIFRSFVVKKIKEIEEEKHQSGKVINEANGELKVMVEPKESEDVAGTTVKTQEEQIVSNCNQALPSVDEKQNDNPDNKENMIVDSITTEQINCPALDNKEDNSTPVIKVKKHKHKHHHKHKNKKKKKKKKRKKDDKKRDHSRSRSKSQTSLKSESDLKLQSQLQSKSHSKSPLGTECTSRESKNCTLLMESGNTEPNKITSAETIDVHMVVPVGVEKDCSMSEIKPLAQDNCNLDQHAKENNDIHGIECSTTGNVSEIMTAESACEQDQVSKLILDRSSDNVQSKSTQTIEKKNKNELSEGRRTKRSRSRSHSKSAKHHKSQLHSDSKYSPVIKSCGSSSRRHTPQSSCSRRRSSPARHRSKSTSRERRKHTESSPKSKRKLSRSRSITKKEQRSKSKSRSPLRIHHKSRSNSIARSKGQSNSTLRRGSRSGSRSKRKSRTRSGSPRRSKSRVKRSHSPRPRSRSSDRTRRPSASRGYLSRLVRTRRSPDWRRRSRSPLRRKSTSRTPERLTDLDKAQLLEIAKANAAAMCAKAGMPLPPNLKPIVPLVKKVITKKMGCSSIQELTEKCKKIVESNDDNELCNKPVSEEDEPFSNQPIKVNELKPISFSLNTPVFKPLSSHPQ